MFKFNHNQDNRNSLQEKRGTAADMQQRLAHDRHRSSLPRRLLRRFSTAAATKQIPTAILDGFSVYSGGRMEIKFHSPSLILCHEITIASLHPFCSPSLLSVTRSPSHHFITTARPLVFKKEWAKTSFNTSLLSLLDPLFSISGDGT
jgi:hypothetical protein